MAVARYNDPVLTEALFPAAGRDGPLAIAAAD